MASIDLSKLDLDDLKQLQQDVGKAIKHFEARRKQEALAAAEATAREMGFSLHEIIGEAPKGKRVTNPPKYRNPENPEVTWTGRGRQPAWIKEGLKAGKSLDDFLIVPK